jgi:hypothetical protein
MTRDVAIVSTLCALLLACSSSSAGTDGGAATDASSQAGDAGAPGDDASQQDASGSDATGGPTGDATLEAGLSDAGSSDAGDGPACAIATYTMADYQGFADSGVYPNLPCGGCAPTSTTCYAGTPDGHGYACWSGSMQSAPPFPSAGCMANGVDVESNKPNLFDVCCP